MPIGLKTLHVSVRFILHKALGLLIFSLAVMNNSLLCSVFKCAVDFLVINNSSKIRRVYRCPPKVIAEILPLKLLQYRRERNPLRDSISSNFSIPFFFPMALPHVYAHVYNRSLLLLVSARSAREVREQLLVAEATIRVQLC